MAVEDPAVSFVNQTVILLFVGPTIYECPSQVAVLTFCTHYYL